MGAVFGQPTGTAGGLLEATFGTLEDHLHAAGVADAAEFVDAADAAVGHLVQGALVAEGILPVVVLVDAVGVLVAEALAGYVRHVGTRHGDDLTRRVGRVIHRWDACGLAPVFAAAPAGHIVEAVIPVVVVLGLAIDNFAKRAAGVLLAAVEHAGIVIAGLAEHVHLAAARGGRDQVFYFRIANAGGHG